MRIGLVALIHDVLYQVTVFSGVIPHFFTFQEATNQQTMCRSPSEAKYTALGSAAFEHQWLLYLLSNLQVACHHDPDLFCDNQSALHTAANPVFHEGTKHLEIDCHFVREKIQAGIMRLLPVPSHAQVADFFTKALPPKSFTGFIYKLGMLDIYQGRACEEVLHELNSQDPTPTRLTHVAHGS